MKGLSHPLMLLQRSTRWGVSYGTVIIACHLVHISFFNFIILTTASSTSLLVLGHTLCFTFLGSFFKYFSCHNHHFNLAYIFLFLDLYIGWLWWWRQGGFKFENGTMGVRGWWNFEWYCRCPRPHLPLDISFYIWKWYYEVLTIVLLLRIYLLTINILSHAQICKLSSWQSSGLKFSLSDCFLLAVEWLKVFSFYLSSLVVWYTVDIMLIL